MDTTMNNQSADNKTMPPLLSPDSQHHPKHKMAIWLVFLVVAGVIGALAYYIATWVDQGYQIQDINTSQSDLTGSDISADINSIDAGSIDADFTSMDKDISGL